MTRKILSEARKAFGLRQNMSRGGVLVELRKIRNSTHPDTTAGEFATETQKERYLLADGFISSLEKLAEGNAQLVVQSGENRDATFELLKIIVEKQSINDARIAEREGRQELEAVRTGLEKSATRRFQRSKFSLWGLGGIGFLLVGLREPIAAVSNSLFVSSEIATIVVSGLSIVSIFFGYLSHVSEQIKKERVRQILTEPGIRLVIAMTNEESKLYGETVDLSDFTDAVARIVGTADLASAEEAAKHIVSQLVNRGLLEPTDDKRLSQSYLTTDEIRDEAFKERDQAKRLIRHNALIGPLSILRDLMGRS